MKNFAPVLLAIAIGALSGLAGALWPKGAAPAVATASPEAAPSPTALLQEPGAPLLEAQPAATALRPSRIELAVFCQQRPAQASVVVRRLNEASFARSWAAPSAPVNTDAKGRADLELPAGVHLLTARAAGCGTMNKPVVVKVGEAVQAVELQLEPGRAVFGTVRDSTTQNPIAGAMVELQQNLGLQSRHHELSPIDEQWSALTDSLGRYRIEGAAKGEYEVRASAGGFADAHVPVDLSTLDRKADLVLEGAGSIEGRVVHATGPATVKDLRSDSKTVFANDDGSFRLSVGAGDHLLFAEDTSGATAMIRVHVVAKAATRDVELKLDKGGKISGHATLGGSPASCARVWIRAESDPWEIASTNVTPEGAFTLDRVPPGRYWLLAECPNGEHGDQLGVEPNKLPIDLPLKQAAGLTGRVVDAKGQAVAGAQLEVSQAQREPVIAVSGGDGHFAFGPLIAGVVDLETTAGDRKALDQKLVLSEGQDVSVEIVVQETAEIKGRLTGAFESVQSIHAWSPSRDSGDSAKPNADGTYSLHVIPGHYRVTPFLVSSHSMALTDEVDVSAGKAATLDFEIPKEGLNQKMETSAPGTIGASFDDGPGGVAVSWIISESPAARAGLQIGDLLLGIDGKPVARSVDAFAQANGKAGSAVRFSLRRGGADQEIVVTRAGKWP